MITAIRKLEAINLAKQVAKLDLDYSHMVDAGYDAIFIHFNGLIVEANDVFANMIECSVDETIGLNAFQLYHPDSVNTIMQKLKEGYELPYEVTGMTRTGKKMLVSLWGMNFQAGELKGRVTAIKKIRDLPE